MKSTGSYKGYEVNIDDASPQGSEAGATNEHLFRDYSLAPHVICVTGTHASLDVSCFRLHKHAAEHRCVHTRLTLFCKSSGSASGNPVSNMSNSLVQVKTRSAFNS